MLKLAGREYLNTRTEGVTLAGLCHWTRSGDAAVDELAGRAARLPRTL